MEIPEKIDRNIQIYAGCYIITIVAGIQCIAWISGFNGSVFALTSLIIGGITGSIFGFSIRKKV